MSETKRGGVLIWLLITLSAVVIAAGGWYYFKHRTAAALTFNTVTVSQGELQQTVTATGILNPVKSVQVGCQVSGRINDIYVDYNSQVKAGDLIAVLDTRVYDAQVDSATADLANATASLELQQVQTRRAAELYTNRLVSASDYDIAVATLHQIQSQVKIKQASLTNALANQGYTKIYSPVDGTVISRAVDVGQTVAASFSTPTLFLIANDLTKMQIDAAVAEADVGGISEGQPVDFTVDAYPNRTFHGVVTQVRNSPTTVNNVVTYDAVIGVTNADYKLKPGMTANVSIIIAQRDSTLKLPNAALRFRPPENVTVLTNELVSLEPATNAPAGTRSRGKGNRNLHTVYFMVGPDGAPQLKPVQVKTGITDGIATEVTVGLKDGDKVVSGILSGEAQTASQTSNPFGGGGFPRR